MSEATDKLAQSRKAILDTIAGRQRRFDPREEPAPGQGFASPDPYAYGEAADDEPEGAGWFERLRYAVRTWWRYHPAHMAVDLGTPILQKYARRKPVQMLTISAGAGLVLTLLRPWRLISITTLLVALLKSSQLSNLLMAAVSAADFRQDEEPPR